MPRPIRPITAHSVISASAVAGIDAEHQEERRGEQDAGPTVTMPADGDAVGEPAGERDRHREDEPGGQQHRAGLRRRQVQRFLHEDRHQVGRAEQRHAVDEGDQRRPSRRRGGRTGRAPSAAARRAAGGQMKPTVATTLQASSARPKSRVVAVQMDHAVEQREDGDRDQAEADESRAGRRRG